MTYPKPGEPGPILPGTQIVVDDVTSIYNGYEGFIQRISGDKAAVLFDDYSPWEKLVTMPIKIQEHLHTDKQLEDMKEQLRVIKSVNDLS